MREILFRGKDINTNKWCYGTYVRRIYDKVVPLADDTNRPYAAEISREVVEIAEEIKHYIFVNGPKGELIEHEIDPETLGQYTSLKDYYETNVFEGDIARAIDEEDILGIIIWEEDEAKFSINYRGYPVMEIEGIADFYIVGNIIDNPELAENIK